MPHCIPILTVANDNFTFIALVDDSPEGWLQDMIVALFCETTLAYGFIMIKNLSLQDEPDVINHINLVR